MDKTGTITKGNFKVQDVITLGNSTRHEILSLAASCEESSTHPIGKSIMEAAKEENITYKTPENAKEIAGHGSVITIDNSEILAGNKKLMAQYHVTGDYPETTSYGTEVFLAKDGVLIGAIVIADTLKDLLKTNEKLEAFIIMSADELPPSSKLRILFETNPRLASYPSYVDDGENLSNLIRQTLVKNGIKKIPDEVLLYLRDNFGENRATTRMELEKLCLYLYGKDSITIDDAMNCVMDSSVLNMGDLPLAVAEGNNKKLSSILPRLLNEGVYPVQLIRTVLYHFKNLYFMAGEVENGNSISMVIENVRPQIFFKLKPSYERQLKFWNTTKIIKIISKCNFVAGSNFCYCHLHDSNEDCSVRN